jgi:hypothetical protein
VQAFWSTPSFSTLSGRAFRVYLAAGRQPSWVTRAALGAGLLVLLSILAIILVPVIAVMVLVFALAAGIARVRRLLAPMRGRNSLLIIDEQDAGSGHGRRNVRVITPPRT